MATPKGRASLTKAEIRTIKALKRVAKSWSKTLWLYSASSRLTVMRYGEDGKQAMTKSGGFDRDYIVDTIEGIPNDGGDW